jgi:phosphoesterase RecJ-like protein
VIDRQALKRWRQTPAAVEGFVEYALAVRGTELSVLFVEEAEVVRVSFRSRGRVRVDGLARNFDGGGHPRAAGARVPGPLAAAKRRVLAEAAKLLDSTERI